MYSNRLFFRTIFRFARKHQPSQYPSCTKNRHFSSFPSTKHTAGPPSTPGKIQWHSLKGAKNHNQVLLALSPARHHARRKNVIRHRQDDDADAEISGARWSLLACGGGEGILEAAGAVWLGWIGDGEGGLVGIVERVGRVGVELCCGLRVCVAFAWNITLWRILKLPALPWFLDGITRSLDDDRAVGRR